ncbi:MAG: tetratricopeptide repeat protein [Polyangiales bacterium]
MDVTCERCSTEYEFDETLVSERGTTVKCTNCGHLFKVYRNEGEGERPWILRRGDGSEQTLASLRELQQAITQGQVEENDRISRSGEAWKRLGDIAELRTFFQAAKAARSATPAPAEGRKQTLFGVGTAPAPSPARVAPPKPAPKSAPPKSAPPKSAPPKPAPPKSAPPKPSPPKSAPPKPTPPKPAPPQPAPKAAPPQPKPSRPAPPKPRPPTPTAPSTPPSRPANVAPRIDESAATHVAPQRAPKLSDAPPAAAPGRAPRLDEPAPPKAARSAQTASLYVDEESPALPSSGGGRPFLWVALILLVAGGVTVGLLWDQVAPLVGMSPDDPAAGFLEEGDTAFSLGTVDGYDDAIRAYTRASAIAPEDPAVYAAIARAEVYWAQMLAFQASDIDARLAAAQATAEANEGESEAAEEAPSDPALADEATRIRAELRRHAERGQENAEIALGLNDGHGAAEVAFASAARLLGDVDAAQTHIDRAQERLPERTPDFHLTRALLAATTGTMSDALDGANAAVEADGSLVLARLTLARAHLSNGNVESAREQTRALLADQPEHAGALALNSAMDSGVPPAAPIVAAGGDEGETPTPEAPVATQTPESETDVETPETPRGETSSGRSSSMRSSTATTTADGPPPEGRDYSWYIGQGDSLMDRGRIGQAREYYQAAVEVRPGASEALTGLGYVELERRRYDSAVRYFGQARRNHYGDAFIGLGEALRRMGRRDEAAQVYEDYLSSRPNGPQANVARRQLEALRPTGGDAPAPTMDEPPAEPTEAPPAEDSTMEAAPQEASPEPAPEPATPAEGDTI